MNENSAHITEADLQAYVDRRLGAERTPAVEQYLAQNAELAQRVRELEAINAAMHEAFDPVLAEPLPAALTAASQKLSAPPSRPSFGWKSGLALAASVLLGVAVGWGVHDLSVQRQVAAENKVALAKEAAIAHAVYVPEVRHPVEVSAAEEAHLVAWLSKRLGHKLRAPKLDQHGYALLGGRLLPGDGEGPGAQFMYQNAAGDRLTLFVCKEESMGKETAFRFHEVDGVRVFYWVDAGFGYALSGTIDRATLTQVADSVYKQLNP